MERPIRNDHEHALKKRDAQKRRNFFLRFDTVWASTGQAKPDQVKPLNGQPETLKQRCKYAFKIVSNEWIGLFR
jgi:hypothetical protein